MVRYTGLSKEGDFLVCRAYCERCGVELLEKRFQDGTYLFTIDDCPHYRWSFYGNASPIVVNSFSKLVKRSVDWVKAEYGYYFLFPR